MTAHETMQLHARRVHGGIAWDRTLFRRLGRPSAQELIDAAVDIAWECLPPEDAPPRPRLDIRDNGALLIIRLSGSPAQTRLPLAA